MAGTDTLRPDANISVGGGWAPTGAGTVHAALADASDATYATNSTSYSRCVIGLDDPTLPAGTIRITGVQILIRAKRNAGASKLSVTAYLNGADDPDTDEFTLTTSIADYTGKIRSRQPNGNLWTATRLNELGVTFKTASGVSNVTVYRVDVIVTWAIAPTVTVTEPTGTQVVSQPTAAIDYSQEDGYDQGYLHMRVFTAAQYTDGGFDPATSPSVWGTGELATDGTVQKITTDLTNGSYQLWARAATVLLGWPLWSDWESLSFTVNFDESSTPILTATPDLTNGRVDLVLYGTDNLLGGQEASLEVEAGTGYWVGTNATLVRSNAQSLHGTWSVRLEAATAADMSIQTSYYLRCKPGGTYQLQAQFRSAVTARQTEFAVAFYDANLALLSTVTSPQTADSAAGWTLPAAFVAAAPAGAVWMRPTLRIKAPALAEQHYIDAIKLSALLSDFSRGGIVDRNLLTRNQSALETSVAGWVTTGATVVTRSTTQAKSGAASLRLECPGSFAASAVTSEGAAGVLVTPGITYTAIASSRAATTVRPVQVGIRFYDSEGANIESQRGTRVTNTNSDWTTQVTVSAVAPSGAVTAGVLLAAGSPASIPVATELHYFDEISLSVDTATVWAPGGTAVGATTPIIQYTDDPATVLDGDATWVQLNRAEIVFDLNQEVALTDNEAHPGLTRRYRARVLATEAGIDMASPWSATVTALLTTTVSRLKNPLDPAMDYAFTDAHEGIEKNPTRIRERAGKFDVLDEDFPVFVTNGMSGDDGAFTCWVIGEDHWQSLRALLRHPGTLQLVTTREARYVRLDGDREADPVETEPGPMREVSADYVEVERP